VSEGAERDLRMVCETEESREVVGVYEDFDDVCKVAVTSRVNAFTVIVHASCADPIPDGLVFLVEISWKLIYQFVREEFISRRMRCDVGWRGELCTLSVGERGYGPCEDAYEVVEFVCLSGTTTRE